jgi:tetratricopeptide (TPR) repeat protein
MWPAQRGVAKWFGTCRTAHSCSALVVAVVATLGLVEANSAAAQEVSDGAMMETLPQPGPALLPLPKEALAAVARAQAAPGLDPAQLLAALNNLAQAQTRARRFDDALAVHNQIIELTVAVRGESSMDVAIGLTERARLARRMGHYPRALPDALRALAIVQTHRPESADEAMALLQVAEIQRLLFHNREALPLYERSLSIGARIGSLPLALAQTHYGLGALHRQMGQYQFSELHYNRAHTLRLDALGPYHADVAESLTGLGGLYRDMGRSDEAMQAYQRALAIYERPEVDDPDALGRAETINNLAFLRHNLGHYGEALAGYSASLALREAALGREHPDSAQTINNTAELYRLLGNPAEAQPRYELSIAIRQRTLGPEHPLVAQSLNNIANLLRALGRYDEAEPRYRRSLEIRRRAFGDMHPVVATSWNNLAMLAQHRGLWAQAIASYERSLAMREQLLGAAHPLIATSLANLASAHLDAGQGDAADPLLLRAERIAAASANLEALWRARFGLMRRHADAKPELAIFWGKLSVNTIQHLRGTLTALDSTIQQSFLLNKREVYTGLADLLLQGGRVVEAQRVIELLKEEEFFDFIRRDQRTESADRRIPLTGRERHAERRHAEASGRLVRLEREHAEWQRVVRAGLDSAHSAERETQWRTRFADAQDQFNAMLADLERHFAAGARGNGSGASVASGAELGDSTELRQHLQRAGPGVAALQYVVAGQRLHIIVTTLADRLTRQQPLPAAQLNETIGRFRQTLQNPRADPRPLGRWLHAALLEPVQADLRQLGVHTLLLQLDGALRYLPFAALVQDDGSYLVERYRLGACRT